MTGWCVHSGWQPFSSAHESAGRGFKKLQFLLLIVQGGATAAERFGYLASLGAACVFATLFVLWICSRVKVGRQVSEWATLGGPTVFGLWVGSTVATLFVGFHANETTLADSWQQASNFHTATENEEAFLPRDALARLEVHPGMTGVLAVHSPQHGEIMIAHVLVLLEGRRLSFQATAAWDAAVGQLDNESLAELNHELGVPDNVVSITGNELVLRDKLTGVETVFMRRASLAP